MVRRRRFAKPAPYAPRLCVFTLIGATTRLVPPSTKLGAHSPLSIVRFSDGYTVVGSRSVEQREIAKWKRYVEEMGIDAGLMGAVTSVSFEQSRILTRDEIARFKNRYARFFGDAMASHPAKRQSCCRVQIRRAGGRQERILF